MRPRASGHVSIVPPASEYAGSSDLQVVRPTPNGAMSPYEHLVADIASRSLANVLKRVIRRLQGLRDDLQSGDDSGLLNAWDEICVQARTESSVAWEAYESTARHMIGLELKRLASHDLCALWLQTDPGEEWAVEQGNDAKPIYDVDDLEDHVFDALTSEAISYTNRRIEAYIYR